MFHLYCVPEYLQSSSLAASSSLHCPLTKVSVTLAPDDGGYDTNGDDTNDFIPTRLHSTFQVLYRGTDFLPGDHAVWRG